jgi:cytidylate kinase
VDRWRHTRARHATLPSRIVTVEREYGSGGALIAKALAARLGWKLWDEELSSEIARVANVDVKSAKSCDERVDPFLYRLFRIYARGSYERALSTGSDSHFDTDQMVQVLHKVIEDIGSRGNSVIVGRGSPYILRARPDVFSVFIYASDEEKIYRLKAIGKTESEARQLVAEVDHDRAAFIQHYFQKQWPHRPLYNMMINSRLGDEYVVESVVQQMALVDQFQPTPAGEAR